MSYNILDNNIGEWSFFPLSSFDEIVEVIHIGLVVFAVVVVKGLGGNSFAKGGLGVRKFR